MNPNPNRKTMTDILITHRRLAHPQSAYAPPQIPIRRFPRTQSALPPRAWLLFILGVACGWLLHSFTH
jgi:hypothetical protein